MKKINLLAAFIVSFISLYSQSFNIGISGGYCLPVATDLHPVGLTLLQYPGYSTYAPVLQSVTPISYGNGGNIALSMDWFSKVNIGFGLKFNALIGTPVEYTQSVTYSNYEIVNYNFTNRGYSYQFVPHLNFKYDFKKISPYIEMGMLIGITNIRESWVGTDNSGDIATSSENLYGNVILGFYSSLGVALRVSKAVRLTFAVNCSAGSYSPAKYKVASYNFNGVNQLSNLPESELQGSFVKQINVTTAAITNLPGQEPKYSIPFSNIGINLGICFVIPTKQPKKQEKNANGFHSF